MYTEIEDNLITLAQAGEFEVISHGCNCFCRQKRGIAPLMAEAFGTHLFPLEAKVHEGDHNKLGQIDYRQVGRLIVINSYTQYHWHDPGVDGIPLDYLSFALCLRKINHKFKGKHVGLPRIGCGLAGGDWTIVKTLIQNELKDCKVTVVIKN